MRSRRRHLYALAELVERHGDVERCRDEYLASLDADDGLVVLLIPADEIREAVAAGRARAPPTASAAARVSRRSDTAAAAAASPAAECDEFPGLRWSQLVIPVASELVDGGR